MHANGRPFTAVRRFSLSSVYQSAAVLFNKGPFLLHERSGKGRQYSLLWRLKNILRTSYFPLMLMHSDIYYKWILCIQTNSTCNTCTAYIHTFIHTTLFSCWLLGGILHKVITFFLLNEHKHHSNFSKWRNVTSHYFVFPVDQEQSYR